MMHFSKHTKQVFLLYGSSVVGLLAGFLVSVLNTRVLSPALYGDVKYVQNNINFVSSLLLFGFFVSGSRILAISKDPKFSRKIRGAMCIILGIALCILVLVLSVLFFISYHQDTGNLTLLYLVAIPVCGNTLMLDYVNTTAQGDNYIGRIAISRCVPYVLYLIIAWILFKYVEVTPALVLGLYNGIAVLVLATVILSTKPSFTDLGEAFRILSKENKEYGFNVYTGSLIAVSTQYLAGIALGHFCSDNSNVAFYTLALSLATPLTMLPSIIGTTYFKQFAQSSRIGRRVFISSVGLTLISFIFFVVSIKFIVGFLYSEEYGSVGRYAAYLAIGTSFHGLGDMMNRFLGAHGLGKAIRNGAIACGTIAVLGNIVLVYLLEIEGAILTRILASSVYCFSMLYYYIRFIRK